MSIVLIEFYRSLIRELLLRKHFSPRYIFPFPSMDFMFPVQKQLCTERELLCTVQKHKFTVREHKNLLGSRRF